MHSRGVAQACEATPGLAKSARQAKGVEAQKPDDHHEGAATVPPSNYKRKVSDSSSRHNTKLCGLPQNGLRAGRRDANTAPLRSKPLHFRMAFSGNGSWCSLA